MVAAGQKFGVDGRSSSGGSYFDATDNNESFPGVPYTKEDFNDYRCIRDIEDIDYESRAENVSVGNQLISRDRFIVEQSKPGLIIYQVRNCRLVGLVDLDQSRRSVRMKIVGYLNKLIAYGVAGFRVDASKHMNPVDLKAILDATNNLRPDIFGDNQRPFVVHEVLDRGASSIKAPEYTGFGRQKRRTAEIQNPP
ncbi:unnamed protein product [Nippostrongylus brasiliensis]|uniref:Alpha-amylase n=1 Tax=Nippostrongylus brasiliensis TaxID=27835 RepID=A0A0N4YF08_NIPBR|nr:unnamed protein product [Nippostrongylus brasiliensis]